MLLLVYSLTLPAVLKGQTFPDECSVEDSYLICGIHSCVYQLQKSAEETKEQADKMEEQTEQLAGECCYPVQKIIMSLIIWTETTKLCA